MAFELPPLPYDYAALEPTIDEATMKAAPRQKQHHQAYVTNPERRRGEALSRTQQERRPRS